MSWHVTSTAAVRSTTRRRARVHPLPVRIMHWINALAIFIMIGSGCKIYNDDILFSFLRFPDAIVIGKWAQYGLQWHFFGMWIFVLNGIAYFCYGIISGRFWQKLFPISPREVFVTVGEALRFRLMPTALHPQTILATKYAGEIIGDPFGYPLRLRTSTKLGYKNAKWIKAIEVTNEFRETYWSERGFNWYAEI